MKVNRQALSIRTHSDGESDIVGVIDGVTEIVFVADVVDRSFTIPEIFVCTLCTPGSQQAGGAGMRRTYESEPEVASHSRQAKQNPNSHPSADLPGVLSTNAFTVISPPVAISNAVTVIDHGGLVTVPIRAVLDSISL